MNICRHAQACCIAHVFGFLKQYLYNVDILLQIDPILIMIQCLPLPSIYRFSCVSNISHVRVHNDLLCHNIRGHPQALHRSVCARLLHRSLQVVHVGCGLQSRSSQRVLLRTGQPSQAAQNHLKRGLPIYMHIVSYIVLPENLAVW